MPQAGLIGWSYTCKTVQFVNMTVYIHILYNFRCLYIRSSLQTEIQAGYRRKKFIYQIIFIPQFLILIHFLKNLPLFFNERYKTAPIMLVKACLDPHQMYHISIFNVLPFDQLMLFIYNFFCCYGNFSLYRFLQTHEKDNKALDEGDKRKSRRRNFVPAKLGNVHLFFLILVYIIYFIIYTFPLNLDAG